MAILPPDFELLISMFAENKTSFFSPVCLESVYLLDWLHDGLATGVEVICLGLTPLHFQKEQV